MMPSESKSKKHFNPKEEPICSSDGSVPCNLVELNFGAAQDELTLQCIAYQRPTFHVMNLQFLYAAQPEIVGPTIRDKY